MTGLTARVLDGRVAVVTGAARGLGHAIAVGLADAGAHTAVVGRSPDAVQATVDGIRACGGYAEGFLCEVTDEASVSALRDDVSRSLGPPDIVVANAGVTGPTAEIDNISLADWRACQSTNLDGVFLTFRAFVPQMRSRRSGNLIAIGSITGKRPLEGRTPYAASKMGVIGLVRTLAADLGPFNVRANTVCPGAVSGERIELVISRIAESEGISTDEAKVQFTRGAALRRFVTPEEVAATCVYLASDAASAITGVDLNVAAGLVMY